LAVRWKLSVEDVPDSQRAFRCQQLWIMRWYVHIVRTESDSSTFSTATYRRKGPVCSCGL